ncbi:MAG TPA: DUF6642 family protein [Bacteroidia bacterium]|jgi:hypothetical protein
MRLSSTYIKNVFCLEGEWGKDLRDRSSIKAALNFMQANFDIKYIYKRCSNRENLEYYVKRWKNKKYQSYSICYLAFHGEEGKIEPGLNEFVTLDELGDILKGACADKVIHFGTCKTIDVPHEQIVKFLKKTKALCVSGFRADVDFFESTVFDLILIDLFQKYKAVSKVQAAIYRNYGAIARRLEFKMVYL